MPNNRIGYQHINIVNIVPSAAMHTPLSIWFQPRRFEGKPGTSVYLRFESYCCSRRKLHRANGQ